MPSVIPHALVASAFAVTALVVSAAPLGAAPPPSARAGRPNILFIAVDDLRPELGCYGARALTPRIDALAASGVRFDRAYCNQAVCGASRVSLMTGLYPEHTGERSYHVTGWRERWADTVTLNQHFEANGYAVVGLGKIYHGSSGPGVDPGNWTEWIEVGGSQYANPESRENTRVTKGGRGQTRRRGPSTEAGATDGAGYPDSRRAAAGAAELAELAAAGRPFFLAVGFTKPHLPFVAPKRFWDLYERERFALPENLGVPPGYPAYASNSGAGELRSYSDIPPAHVPPAEFPDALNQRLVHGYHACVSYLDHNVGILLDALDESGAAEDTIVVLWGDHGWKLGDHSSWCKHTNFECDARVPLIVRAPGKAPAASGSLVELIDLYPTLCDLAGLEKPGHLQGRSFAATLADPAAEHRTSAYSSYAHGGRVGHSLRTERFRYTEWWDKGDDRVVDKALTDLAADPGETTSALAGHPEEAERLSTELRRRVLAARRR